MTTITAMHVREVEVIADQPVIEVRLAGKLYRRWNGYYLHWIDRHTAGSTGGVVVGAFELMRNYAAKDFIDAAIATVHGAAPMPLKRTLWGLEGDENGN